MTPGYKYMHHSIITLSFINPASSALQKVFRTQNFHVYQIQRSGPNLKSDRMTPS